MRASGREGRGIALAQFLLAAKTTQHFGQQRVGRERQGTAGNGRLSAAAALLGTHTDEVLHEVLDLDSAAIRRLHDAGVVSRGAVVAAGLAAMAIR